MKAIFTFRPDRVKELLQMVAWNWYKICLKNIVLRQKIIVMAVWSPDVTVEKLKRTVTNYYVFLVIIIISTRKTFGRFTTKDSYTWNITHNTESTAVWSLKPERWGSPLVHEKYQEEKACDKTHPYRIIIIIIIIIIINGTTSKVNW